MLMTHFLELVAHTLAVLALVALIWIGVRSVVRRSHVIGAIFIAGVMTRLVLGVALFSISYLRLPFAPALQLGGGFWTLTPDAQGYYELAASVVVDPASVPSPFFIRTLALWMSVVGMGPLAGMFLNLCLYAGVVVALVYTFRPANEWQRDLPAIGGIAAYSFSPVILIHATQPLKDELSSALMISACLGMLALRRVVYGNRVVQGWTVLGMAAFSAAEFGTVGIRWYYALILWNAAAITLILCGLWRRTTPLHKYTAGTAGALMIGWLGLWAGAGPFYPAISAYMTLGPAHLGMVTQLSRRGFLMTGGGTNLVVRLHDDPTIGKTHAFELVKEQYLGELKRLKEAFDALPTLPSRTIAGVIVLRLPRPRGTKAAAEARTPRVDAKPNVDAATGKAQELWLLNEQFASPKKEQLASERKIRGSAPATLPSRTATGIVENRLPPQPSPGETEASAEARKRRVDAEQNQAARAIPVRLFEHVRVVVTGLSFVFLPTSIASRLLRVEMAGGQGLLPVADVDTVFQDVTLMLIGVLLWRRKCLIGDRLPLVIFGLLLSVSSACLLAYVVTNFGTMWRLRSLVAIPFWMTFLALSPQPERPPRGDAPSSRTIAGASDIPAARGDTNR
jgi:hypothetical protein